MKLKIGVFLFLLMASAAWPEVLMLQGKKAAFYLDEKSGAFYLENPNPVARGYKTLLFKDTPPTSFITMILGGRPFRLDELPMLYPYRVSDKTVSAVYRQDKMLVEVSYTLTNFSRTENDSVVVTLKIKNLSDAQTVGGARLLFDTVYGEVQKKVMLYIDSGEKMEYDRIFRGEVLPEFIYSGAPQPETGSFDEGLFIYPSINSFQPSQVMIGNWKRFSENELDYTIDPLSKFRYNQFGDPDGAVAVFYQNMYIKPGETVAFGTILSTSRFKTSGLDLAAPVTTEPPAAAVPTSTPAPAPVQSTPVPVSAESPAIAMVTPAPAPSAASAIVTNLVLPAGSTNDLLLAQLEFLRQASKVLERLEASLSQTNVAGISTQQVQAQPTNTEDPLRSGAWKAGTYDWRVDGRPAVRSQPTAVPQAQVTPAPYVTPSPQVSPGFVPATPAPVWVTNLYTTNIGYAESDMERLREEKSALMQAYDQKLKEMEQFYQAQLKKQEEEFKSVSEDYRNLSEGREKRRQRNERLSEMNRSIDDLDRRLGAITELLGLNLDFESMPASELEKWKKRLEILEQSSK